MRSRVSHGSREKSHEIEITSSCGATLITSSDGCNHLILNPIEEAFAQVKAFVRRHNDIFRADPGCFYDLRLVLEMVGPDICKSTPLR
jgi:hypothetical protein